MCHKKFYNFHKLLKPRSCIKINFRPSFLRFNTLTSRMLDRSAIILIISAIILESEIIVVVIVAVRVEALKKDVKSAVRLIESIKISIQNSWSIQKQLCCGKWWHGISSYRSLEHWCLIVCKACRASLDDLRLAFVKMNRIIMAIMT